MLIEYKKKSIKINLVLGLVWLVFFLVTFIRKYITKEDFYWMDFGWAVISAVYLIIYYYQTKNQYITIENDVLRIKNLFKKDSTLNLKELTSVKNFAGDYIFQTPNKKLTVNTQIIDEESLKDLNEALSKYEFEWI